MPAEHEVYFSIILGILLGNNREDSLRRADGDWTYLFSSAIAIGLWIAAIAGFIAPMFLHRLVRKPADVG